MHTFHAPLLNAYIAFTCILVMCVHLPLPRGANTSIDINHCDFPAPVYLIHMNISFLILETYIILDRLQSPTRVKNTLMGTKDANIKYRLIKTVQLQWGLQSNVEIYENYIYIYIYTNNYITYIFNFTTSISICIHNYISILVAWCTD